MTKLFQFKSSKFVSTALATLFLFVSLLCFSRSGRCSRDGAITSPRDSTRFRRSGTAWRIPYRVHPRGSRHTFN